MHPKVQAALAIDEIWAINEPSAFALIEAIEAVDPIEAAALVPQRMADDAPKFELSGDVAIIAMGGVMTKKPNSMAGLIGGCSTIEISACIRAAMRDPRVGKILLCIDSPGGQMDGVADLADAIFAASQQKPIWCFADGEMTSAAYIVGCQAEKVYASQTSTIGSIACFTVLEDTSEKAAKEGRKVHVIKSGKFKAIGVPGTKVTDEQIAERKRSVDAMNEIIVSEVMRGRGVSAETAKDWNTGSVWIGKGAEKHALIDGIATKEQVLSQMQSGLLKARTAATAGNTITGENTMASGRELLSKLTTAMAGVLGIGDPDNDAAGGGETEPAATPAVPTETQASSSAAGTLDPIIAKQLEELAESNKAHVKELAVLRNQNASALALSFADEQISAAKAFPKERDAIAGLFLSALKADGDGVNASYNTEGQLVEGSNVKAVRDAYAARPSHSLFGQMIQNADPTAKTSLDGAAPDPAVQASLLDMTPIGRKAKAQKEGK